MIESFIHDFEKNMRKNQMQLEDVIFEYGKAADQYAEYNMQYEKSIAKSVTIQKNKGVPATLIEKLARGEHAELRRDVIQAEYNVKRLAKMITAYEHRINNMKFIAGKINNAGG